MNEESLHQANELAEKLYEKGSQKVETRSTESIMEDYKIFLQAEIESPEMRSLVEKYIAQIIVNKERVTISLNLPLGNVSHTKSTPISESSSEHQLRYPKRKPRLQKRDSSGRRNGHGISRIHRLSLLLNQSENRIFGWECKIMDIGF